MSRPGVTAAISDVLGSAHNLIMPVLGMYGGQFLIAALPRSKGWGLAVIAVSLVLLLLRLRPATAGGPADALQMILGILVGLPLALNVDDWKAWNPTWHLVAVWLLSCMLVMLAALRLKPQPIKLGIRFQRLDRLDLLMLIVLVGGALLLRVPFIETIPSGVDPDEASLALSAVDAAVGVAKDPFGTGWVTHPTLQFFVNGLFIRWLGRTFLAMRLPSAIVGSLAVATLYLLARVGYGRRVAVLVGVLAMGSNVAIHFSRLGINNVTDSLFATWVLAALWLAGVSGDSRAYVLAGAGLGLAQYYYFGNRAIPFVVLANLLVWLIADWRGVLRARYLILASILVALVVAEPLVGHWARNPGSVSEHLGLTLPFSTHLQDKAARMNVPLMQLWWQQVYESPLVFTVVPDRGSFYHPGQPMLHPLQAPFFLIGVLTILAGWRRSINQGVLAWMAVTLTLGSVLITDPATFHRLLGVLPAGILLVAIGVDTGATVLTRSVRASPRVAPWLAAIGVVVLAAVDVHYYFRIYNVEQAYKTPTQEAVSIAALEYQRLGGQGEFVLFTREGVDEAGKIYHSPIDYVAGDAFKGGAPRVVDQLDTGQPLYFYVLPDRADELPKLMTRFPAGVLKEYRRSADDLLLMTRYLVAPTVPR